MSNPGLSIFMNRRIVNHTFQNFDLGIKFSISLFEIVVVSEFYFLFFIIFIYFIFYFIFFFNEKWDFRKTFVTTFNLTLNYHFQ